MIQFPPGPGDCLLCGENERSATYNVATDSTNYSHACTECQAEAECYWPCRICKSREADGWTTDGQGRNVEAEMLFICHECHRRIKMLLERGFTPKQIACAPKKLGNVTPIQQICEGVKIGIENWVPGPFSTWAWIEREMVKP